MTKNECLLNCLSEECVEVSYAVSKALRFGLNGNRPGDARSNLVVIVQEINDLLGAIELLVEEGILPETYIDKAAIDRKKVRILQHL